MKNYRISKYNPKNRNEYGHYTHKEWICPSEVNSTIDGKLFSPSEYFSVEKRYIDTAIDLIKSQNLDSLRIVGLEMQFTDSFYTDEDTQWLLEKDFKTMELYEDKLVSLDEIPTIIKMNLRNMLYCTLEIDSKFLLRFGYDYYMYMLVPDNVSLAVIQKAYQKNIFIEKMSDFFKPIEYVFSILISKKEHEFVDETIPLPNMTREKIRQGLGFSRDHPCNHHFKINEKHSTMFEDFDAFDFTKNNYFLDCDTIYN